MKMVKSLLLGTAAGLVAVAGAQAADLPVKAKPVEYVKICSVYGEGFFYIPGTDTCIKIGGYVRQNFGFGQVSGSFAPKMLSGSGRDNPIDQSEWVMQSTFVTSFDVRTQTEYGTLRAFTRAGFRVESENYDYGTYYVERAFIQLGGWTFGRTSSFFDYLSGAFGYQQVFLGGGGSSAAGRMLGAYTWSFGNGVSWTSSIEDPTTKRGFVWDAGDFANGLTLGAQPGPNGSTTNGYTTCGSNLIAGSNSTSAFFPVGTVPTLVGCPIGDYAAQKLPDFVSQLNVSQAWGSAQLATGLHQISTGYYGNNLKSTDNTFTGVQPKDKYGFAIMGGISLNIGSGGDKVYVEAAYGQGTPGYEGLSEMDLANSVFLIARDNRIAGGWVPDAVFFNAGGAGCTASTTVAFAVAGVVNCTTNPNAAPMFSGIQLTTTWTIAAAYEHYWTPAVRTSIYGVFTAVSFNNTAKLAFCDTISGLDGQTPYRTVSGIKNDASSGVVTPGCNPNFNIWGLGVRTIWNPVKNLDVGLEVFRDEIDQKYDPNTWFVKFTGSGGQPSGKYQPANMGVWGAMLRVQRNFYP